MDVDVLAPRELGGSRSLIVGQRHVGSALMVRRELHDRMAGRILFDRGDFAADADVAVADPGLGRDAVRVVVLIQLLGGGLIDGGRGPPVIARAVERHTRCRPRGHTPQRRAEHA